MNSSAPICLYKGMNIPNEIDLRPWTTHIYEPCSMTPIILQQRKYVEKIS